MADRAFAADAHARARARGYPCPCGVIYRGASRGTLPAQAAAAGLARVPACGVCPAACVAITEGGAFGMEACAYLQALDITLGATRRVMGACNATLSP